MFNSLKFKIASTIFILEIILLSLVMWQVLESSFQQNKQDIEAVKETTLKLLNQTARTALFSEEYDTIQFRIESIIDEPHIANIFLADSRNIVVASNQFNQLGRPPPTIVPNENAYWKIKKISNLTGDMGDLYVEYSFFNINRINRSILFDGFVKAVMVTFVIAGVSLLFGYLLTRRLNIVTSAAESISHGNYYIRTKLKGKDEISKLGHTFDNMAAYIESEKRKLSELNQQLEQKVAARTKDYENANKELEAFCHAVSHDLRAPLRSIDGFSLALSEDYLDALDDTGKDYIQRLRNNTSHMAGLIENLLKLSKINQYSIELKKVNLSEICSEIIERLKEQQADRQIIIHIERDVQATADRQLITIALENLLSNAWKYTQKVSSDAVIEFACKVQNDQVIFFVKDNGAGFDMKYANKLFAAFQRLHRDTEFKGSGVGLSTVQRIIHRHGGEIWAESEINQGSCFFFTLGVSSPVESA